MSEEFAKTLVMNLNKKIRFAKSESTKKALRDCKDAVIKTMEDLGHTNIDWPQL